MADLRAPTSRAVTASGDAKKLADLHALLEVSCQLGANSELGPLLQTIEQATLRVLDCERTTIFLYDRQDEELVRTFGAQAGVAVQRQLLMDEYVEKQRLKEDLRIAHDIQQGLLPRQPPHVPNYDIAGWNRPTDETGGDFYDFQLLGSGTL